MGVLALLSRSIPGNVRVFLLALAIIDDIIAVLIIALFYSGGLDLSGFLVAAMGILVVLGFQRMGVGSAFAYVLPGAIVWTGLLMTGAHPTLAGVVLGMLTPVLSRPTREHPLDMVAYAAQKLRNHDDANDTHRYHAAQAIAAGPARAAALWCAYKRRCTLGWRSESCPCSHWPTQA